MMPAGTLREALQAGASGACRPVPLVRCIFQPVTLPQRVGYRNVAVHWIVQCDVVCLDHRRTPGRCGDRGGMIHHVFGS